MPVLLQPITSHLWSSSWYLLKKKMQTSSTTGLNATATQWIAEGGNCNWRRESPKLSCKRSSPVRDGVSRAVREFSNEAATRRRYANMSASGEWHDTKGRACTLTVTVLVWFHFPCENMRWRAPSWMVTGGTMRRGQEETTSAALRRTVWYSGCGQTPTNLAISCHNFLI